MKNKNDLHDELFQWAAQHMKTIEDLEYLERHKAMKEQLQSRIDIRFLAGVLTGLIIAICLLWATGVQASNEANRFRLSNLVQGHGYLWDWSEAEPYTVLRPMCWDDSIGFCDPEMQGAWTWRTDNHVVASYEIYDRQLDRFGTIYSADFGCYLLWWVEERDSAGNPHMTEIYWIECPDPLVLEYPQ